MHSTLTSLSTSKHGLLLLFSPRYFAAAAFFMFIFFCAQTSSWWCEQWALVCFFFAHLRLACSFEWNHSITFIWISQWFQSITFRNSRIFIFFFVQFHCILCKYLRIHLMREHGKILVWSVYAFVFEKRQTESLIRRQWLMHTLWHNGKKSSSSKENGLSK